MAGGYRAEYCRPCLRIPISTRSHPRCDCFLVRALPQGGRQGRTRGRGSVGACGGANVWAQERNGALGRREGGREEVTPGRRTRRQNQLPQARSSYGPSEPRAAQPREKPPRPPEAPPTRARPAPRPRRRRCGRSSCASSGSQIGGRFVTGNLREPAPRAQIFSAISLGPESPCCVAT